MISKPTLSQMGMPLLAASTFVLPFATPTAAALVSIGDHANLFFNGSATVRADDNIFLDESDEESDVIFILSPGLELDIGNSTNANVNLSYREDFYLYTDNSDLDSNQSNVYLDAFWSQARLDLSLNASFEQLIQASPDTLVIPGQLVERDFTRAGIRGEYEIGARTSASVGIDSSFTSYESPVFADRDIVSIPVNFYYELTPLVDVSLGYRYRQTDVDDRLSILSVAPSLVFGPARPGVDYEDHYFNVGVRGELAPKLIGEARVGYQERQLDNDEGDDSGLSFGVDLSHFTTARTTLTAGLFRDYETGGRGAGILSTGGSLGVNHALSHLLSARAGVNYFERDWETNAPGDSIGREDETLDFNVGVTYSPNMYLDLSAGYIFRTNDSSFDAFEYDSNILSFTAALRY